MEDLPVQSPDEDQEDQKKKKKRRIPTFISTYLARGEKAQEEPKKPFSERAWGVFQKFFNREAERPDKIEDPEAKTEKTPQQFLDFAGFEVSRPTPVEDETTTTSPTEVPETIKQPEKSLEQPSEGGELVIDHEEEETPAPDIHPEAIPAELPPLVEPPIIAMQRQMEIAQRTDNELTGAAEVPTPSSQPEKLGDLLDKRLDQDERNYIREKQRNRRRNRKLKKQVRELKGENSTQTKQQEALKKEQAELKSQVEQLRRQPEVSKLIERQEHERAELRANRGIANTKPEKVPERPRPVVKTEADRFVRPENRQPVFETPVQSRRPVEAVRSQFEIPEVEDTRSERYFDSRHEIKDEVGSPVAAGYAAMASADAAYRMAAAQIEQATAAQNKLPEPPLPAPQPSFQPSDIVGSPMYRQAMRNGFLTAVILLAVWLVIYIAS